jgi:hypothetical protein
LFIRVTEKGNLNETVYENIRRRALKIGYSNLSSIP